MKLIVCLNGEHIETVVFFHMHYYYFTYVGVKTLDHHMEKFTNYELSYLKVHPSWLVLPVTKSVRDEVIIA